MSKVKHGKANAKRKNGGDVDQSEEHKQRTLSWEWHGANIHGVVIKPQCDMHVSSSI